MLGIAVAASCTVYDQKLIDEAKGSGAVPGFGGSGATGGDGSGGASASGGDGTGGTGGSSGGGALGGTSGGGGASAGKAGSGGSSGASGGKGGTTGGSSGNGGMTSAGAAGMMDGGEGGEPVDPCPGGDCCPEDELKTMPGACGCGMPDTDSDDDGTPDCDDMCPNDELRTQEGACGACDVEYTDADCAELSTALKHRYSFNGTGTVIEDSAGGADGALMQTTAGATQSGGVVTLPGGSTPATDAVKAYVELPTGCLDGLTSATFEAWVTWSTTCTQASCTNRTYWQRVFDFGEGTITGTTGSNIFLSPRRTDNAGPVFSASTTAGSNGETAAGGYRVDGAAITAGDYHFALVVDDEADEVRLYVNGVLATPVMYANPATYGGLLSNIVATNCWLGRSNYTADAYFNGSFDEFRIYDAALTASAVRASYDAGPNAEFL